MKEGKVMKKIFISLFVFAMCFGTFKSVRALETRGMVLDPKRITDSAYATYGSTKLFKLNHSAYFIPNSLGTNCSVQNHTVSVSNINSVVSGTIFKSKTTSSNGFKANGKAYTYHQGAYRYAYTELVY